VRVLVLGGTRFVGRALVDEALARGHDVTVLNRGTTGRPPAAVRVLTADRTDPAALRAALADGRWDAVLDTWSGAPGVVADAVAALRDRAPRYGYVSTRSVYRWPIPRGADEQAPVVDADPNADATSYPADKRGAELAVRAAYPDALVLRAGLILGPHEDLGRLPWWLQRIARGGQVVAPGRPDRGLQYVDARDLAAFALQRLGDGGTFDVTCRVGHCSTEDLLEACIDVTGSDAELVWVDEDALTAAGVEAWTQVPCWVPERGELAGLMAGDVSKALAVGLTCRPVEETVTDTWAWLQEHGPPPPRADRPPVGLPPQVEAALLGG
jgi:2'-hydroxyisoflavone reductase